MFKRYAGDHFAVETIVPPNTIDELVRFVDESGVQAVIVDHNLSEKAPDVTYDGVDAINAIQRRRQTFPVFVLTSYDDKAIAEADDVNYVYPKSVMLPNKVRASEKITFNDRIDTQITHYLNRLESAEVELEKLIKIANERALTGYEEERMIELDTLLSDEMDRTLDVPKQVKSSPHLTVAQELVEVSERLLKAIEDKKR